MTRLQRHSDGGITLHTEVAVHVPAGTSMLEAEERLMAAVNETGAGLTGQLLSSLDADGHPLVGGNGRTLTAKRGKEGAPRRNPLWLRRHRAVGLPVQ